MTSRIVWIVFAILAAAVVVLLFMLRHARGELRDVGLRADSLEAVADTNRRHVLSAKDSAKLLGDSLIIVQRRVVQVAAERDAFDRALRLERIAKGNLVTEVARLRAGNITSTRPTTDSAGVRSATFDIRRPPYTVFLGVSLPPAPSPGRVDTLDVAIDRIPITIREGCGERNAQGIRAATWTITSPPWATVHIERVEQDPELCNPTTRGLRGGFFGNFFGTLKDWTAVGPSYSLVWIDGRPRSGFGASVVLRVWPR